MKHLGDRRAYARLEVVGTLWGTLELDQPAEVVNLSDAGALVATRAAPVPHSIQSIELNIEGQQVRLDVRVRHFEERPDETGERAYLVGLEFLRAEDVIGSQ